MNILPVSPLASPVTSPIDSVLPAAYSIDKLAAETAQQTAPVTAPVTATGIADDTASSVNFSTFAQLLEATVALQPGQMTQQSATAATAAPAQASSGTSFGELYTNANLFVTAFNNFQISSASSFENPLGASPGLELLQAIRAQSVPGSEIAGGEISGSGSTLINDLARIGINLQESVITGTGQLTLDPEILQSAYNADPAATTALMTTTLQAIGSLEVQLMPSDLTAGLGLTAYGIESFASSGVLPPSLFESNFIAAQQSSLGTQDAQRVDAALRQLISDQALSDAFDASAIDVLANFQVNSQANVFSQAQAVAPVALLPVANALNNQPDTTMMPLANTPDVSNAGVDARAFSNAQSGLVQLLADAAAARQNNAPTGAEAFVASFISSATNSNMLTRAAAGLENMPQPAPRLVPLAQVNMQAASVIDTGNMTDTSQSQAANILREESWVPDQTPLRVPVQMPVRGPLMENNQPLQQVPVIAAEVVVSPTLENRNPVVAGEDNVNLTGANVAATALAANSAVATALARELMLPTTINPSIAAAVAAYRVNDAVESTPAYVLSKRASVVVPDISAVVPVTPDALDPHEGSGENRQDPAGQNGRKTAAHITPEKITETPLPGSAGLDVIA